MNHSGTAQRPPALFITGASSGIGAAVSRRFLAAGWRVWGTARDVGRLTDLSAHPSFQAVALDLADREATLQAYAEAEAEAGEFAVVVNNAGYGLYGPFADAPDGDALLSAMVNHTTALIRAQVRSFVARKRGTLVNVSSLAVDFPLPFMSSYNMAKAALSALSESLMQEFRGTDIHVIDFRPGDVKTCFNQAMTADAVSSQGEGDLAKAWQTLEKNVREAPPPEKIAEDLWKVVRRSHSGVVRAGGFFQARLAPILIRLAPTSLARRIRWWYFGLK